jgi:hypothetical protein
MVELSEDHADIIESALDLYVRIGLGQFDEIVRVYDWGFRLPPDVKEKMRETAKTIKVMAGHPPHGSYGLLHPEVCDRFRVAYDIIQAFRERNSRELPTIEPLQASYGPLPVIRPVPAIMPASEEGEKRND